MEGVEFVQVGVEDLGWGGLGGLEGVVEDLVEVLVLGLGWVEGMGGRGRGRGW